LEVHPVAILALLEDSGVGELGEFALEAGRRQAQVARDLTEIPGALRLQEEHREQTLPGFGKESVEDGRFSLHAYYLTLNA